MHLAPRAVHEPQLWDSHSPVDVALCRPVAPRRRSGRHFQREVWDFADLPRQIQLALSDGLDVDAEGDVAVGLYPNVQVGAVVAEDGVAGYEHRPVDAAVRKPVGEGRDYAFCEDRLLEHGVGLRLRFAGDEVNQGVYVYRLPLVGNDRGLGVGFGFGRHRRVSPWVWFRSLGRGRASLAPPPPRSRMGWGFRFRRPLLRAPKSAQLLFESARPLALAREGLALEIQRPPRRAFALKRSRVGFALGIQPPAVRVSLVRAP